MTPSCMHTNIYKRQQFHSGTVQENAAHCYTFHLLLTLKYCKIKRQMRTFSTIILAPFPDNRHIIGKASRAARHVTGHGSTQFNNTIKRTVRSHVVNTNLKKCIQPFKSPLITDQTYVPNNFFIIGVLP